MANLTVQIGRLVADPELRQTPDGIPVTSFSIAVPRKYRKDVTDFFDVVVWRKAAEFTCQYFTKGKWIEVVGSLQSRTYEDKEGKKRKIVEIVAEEVNFVGDKPKDESTPASAPPPNAPAGLDPFKSRPPVYSSGEPSDFAEYDEDGDLPF